MSSYTSNLNLLKKDPTVDGNDTFNIKTMLNDNWDKIDTFCNSSKAKITTGSYVGTGACGSTNQNTLTFDFEPKLVFILGRGGYKHNGIEHNVQALMVQGSTNANSFGFAADYAPSTTGARYAGGLTVSWSGNSVSWYLNKVTNPSDSLSNTLQLNVANVTYNYIALG